MPPTIVRLAALMVAVSVPLAAVALGFVFDRLFGGRPLRLGLLAVLLAAVASALLLLLPLRTERVTQPGTLEQRLIRRSILEEEGLRGLAIGAIPVAAAALPVIVQTVLGPQRFGGIGRVLAPIAYLPSLLFLVGAMYFLAASLVGFLYLPSIAALGAAAVRAGSAPARDGGSGGRTPRPRRRSA